MKQLLLLSNSTMRGHSFLAWPEEHIKTFLGSEIQEILFIPYAAVHIAWAGYKKAIQKRFDEMGYAIESVYDKGDPVEKIHRADAIVVGGGNTFALLYHVYRYQLLKPIQERVAEGIPYIGWSAGSNLACPSIRTTNDMPIIEPPSMDALNLIPFQLNPHYTDFVQPDHGGESRDDRINEFLTINKDMPVVGLREGSGLIVKDEHIQLVGNNPVKIFRHGEKPLETTDVANLFPNFRIFLT
ncbi:MAG: dipeptidase PepE [Candidatus Marinimicrobia bacterium]|nr:dipeptidase PepE [Candidatus Neomarinimicrobiota bacterium]